MKRKETVMRFLCVLLISVRVQSFQALSLLCRMPVDCSVLSSVCTHTKTLKTSEWIILKYDVRDLKKLSGQSDILNGHFERPSTPSACVIMNLYVLHLCASLTLSMTLRTHTQVRKMK